MNDKIVIFTIDDKKKILNRINKLKSRTDHNEIKNIISKNNVETNSMTNTNGIFYQFNNLSTKTYTELLSFLDKLDKIQLKKLQDEILESSDAISDDTTQAGNTDKDKEKNISKKLRYTNTESNIINRIKYENELKKNENMTEEGTQIYNPNVMVKKKNHTKSEIDDIFVHAESSSSKEEDIQIDKNNKCNKKIVIRTEKEDNKEDNNKSKKNQKKIK